MKRLLILFTFFILMVSCRTQEQTSTFKVMAWNILHGANDIENGPQNAIKIIKEINPDIIVMVETYGSGKMIADSLGYNFHLIAPEGTALDDKSVNLSIFSNWFHYLPWNNEPEKMGKTAEELLEWERTETRYNMIQKVLPTIKKYASQSDSIPMIFGGDMNTPSHLVWSEGTAKMHNNLIVPWYATKVLDELGLIDSYREVNPDPISHPGITWDGKGKRDEHRIDYIFYKNPKLKAVKSESYNAFLDEPLIINGKEIMYPSDHGIVVSTFELRH